MVAGGKLVVEGTLVQARGLVSHTTRLAYKYARQGGDWEEALRPRAKELAMMRELGLTSAQTRNRPPVPGGGARFGGVLGEVVVRDDGGTGKC